MRPLGVFTTRRGGQFRPAPSSRSLLPALILLGSLAALTLRAEAAPLSQRVANLAMERWPADGMRSEPSTSSDRVEEFGPLLEAVSAVWYNSADGDYFRYVKRSVDTWVDLQGANASNVSRAELSNDAQFDREILLLYRVTLDAKYYRLAEQLHRQMVTSCKAPAENARETPAGLACESFLAEYAAVFEEPGNFAQITAQFVRWDERIGRLKSPGSAAVARQLRIERARLLAAIVDSLLYYPSADPGRAQLVEILRRSAAAVVQDQDGYSGFLNHASEGSADTADSAVRCFVVYGLAKGVRLGYLPAQFSETARRGWALVQKQLPVDGSGAVSLAAAAQSNLARKRSPAQTDGSSPAGPGTVGAFLLAAVEMELAPTAGLGRGDTVLLDAWFNSQQRKNAAGQMESFHYKWSDFSDSGYSLLGHLFESYGAVTDILSTAPTQSSLDAAQYYIIVSPDIPVKNPNPHYMTSQDAAEIAAWVKRGGILVIFENDPPNADIAHLNLLADQFGIHFDDVLHHHVIGEQVESGRIPVAGDGPLFHRVHTLYMKDTCAISLRKPATTLLRDRGDTVMATVKYGRGMVFAAVDPWLYNEYTDGRKDSRDIYKQFDNFAGGRELVQWLLQQRLHAGAGARRK